MTDQMGRFWEACSVIDAFRVKYNARWSDFANLKQLHQTFAPIDEKHWVRVMQDKTKPHWKKRNVTIRVAELIETAPDVLFAHMPSAREGRSQLQDGAPGSTFTNPERVDLYVQGLIDLAGQGQARHIFTLLVLQAMEALPYAHEEAVSRLRSAIYIANRYLPPPYFASCIRRLVLPSLQHATLRIPPIDRGLILSQLACYSLDHGCGGFARDLYHHPDVRMIRSEARSGTTSWAQTFRNFSWLRGAIDGKPSEAMQYVETAGRLRTHSNLKSVAISKSSLYRLANDPKSAWTIMEPFYLESRNALFAANNLGDLSYHDLVHNFACMFIGAICRSGASARYTPDERHEDLGAIKSIVSRSAYLRTDNVQFESLTSKFVMPRDFELFRRNCIASRLSDEEVDILKKLSLRFAGDHA